MKTKKFLSIALISALALSSVLTSCKKEEEETFGILTMSLSMPNGQTVECTVDQATFAINNAADPVEPGLPAAMYQMTVTYTSTLSTTVKYNGEDVVSGTTVIDFSEPVTLTANKGGKTNTYTVTVMSDANDKSETEGKKVNADMTKAGFPNCAWFDVALFKDCFYAITSSYPDGTAEANTAYYNVYKSEDGISWTKVSTSIKAVGAYGAKLVEFNGKLFAFGGGKYYGTDEDGNAPESMWGMFPDITQLFAYSTTDGTDWQKLTITKPSVFMNGYVDPKFQVIGNNLVFLGGLACTYGQLQNGWGYATSADGETWTNDPVAVNTIKAGGDYALQNCATVFNFKGKVFQLGGFKNFIDYASKDTYNYKGVWSTTDGTTWNEETTDGGYGILWNASVVGTEDVLYMVGGDTFAEDGKVVASAKVFRSTDGINWTELSGENAMSSAFAGRSRPAVVANGDMMWVFGGRGPADSGYYGGPDATDEMIFDTWKKRIK